MAKISNYHSEIKAVWTERGATRIGLRIGGELELTRFDNLRSI